MLTKDEIKSVVRNINQAIGVSNTHLLEMINEAKKDPALKKLVAIMKSAYDSLEEGWEALEMVEEFDE